MYNTVLFRVSIGSQFGPASEVFSLGNILPGMSASAAGAYGWPGATDYWTLLFDPLPLGVPGQCVYSIPTTASNIASIGNGQVLLFNVESDGECTINNPVSKDVTVNWAPLASGAAYAFLSNGATNPAAASTAQPAQLSARA
jgi:hypothetical protein